MFGLIDFDNLEIENLIKYKEDQYFDRKSASIKAKKLAESLIAFANADGGIVAVGIDNGQIEGVNSQGSVKINDFIQVKMDQCQPAIRTSHKFIDVKNYKGEEDRILVIKVEPSTSSVHRTMSDKVFLRVGDENKELTHHQRLELEYDKGERLFEEQIIQNCTIDDLNTDVLESYKQATNFQGEQLIDPLIARGFILKTDNSLKVTVAGVLLFANHPERFLPSARIRFIRYEGSSEEVGVEMNIVKQEFIEGPLPLIIQNTKTILESQLRQFTALNPMNGKFNSVPEYPEFAWLEGIVNAVTHRSYSIQGDDIKIKMFDDRLEIQSPGKFPNIVNKQNIKEVRYSRNPRIARALTELGWVKELGEGVKRIYKEMDSFFLNEPEYQEMQNSVHLVLRNNIMMRRIRRLERIDKLISREWSTLSVEEQKALEFIYNRSQITTRQLSDLLGRSTNYSKKILENLEGKGILRLIRSSINDPNQYYEFQNN